MDIITNSELILILHKIRQSRNLLASSIHRYTLEFLHLQTVKRWRRGGGEEDIRI